LEQSHGLNTQVDAENTSRIGALGEAQLALSIKSSPIIGCSSFTASNKPSMADDDENSEQHRLARTWDTKLTNGMQ